MKWYIVCVPCGIDQERSSEGNARLWAAAHNHDTHAKEPVAYATQK